MSEGKGDRLTKVILALRNGLALIVEELNEVLKDMMAEAEAYIPRIDLAVLEAAPWLTYHTKEPAKPGKAAWIKNPVYFTSFEAPPVIMELVKALKKSPGEKLVLGDMEYTFSGEGKFISRKPVKT